MIVYDINAKLNFGILLDVGDTTLSISAYAFKEGSGSLSEVESPANREFMANIDIFHTQTITLEELKSLPEWEDYALWNVIVKDFRNLELSQPINRNSFTMSSKINRAGFINIFSSIMLELIVPHKQVAGFDEVGIAVTTGKGFPLICNVPCEDKDPSLAEDSGMGQELRRRMLPALSIAGPDSIPPDGTAEYSLTATMGGEPLREAVNVYLESTGGYLPMRRLEKVTGTVFFTLRADALLPGQRVTLKAGFKYWSALARKEISIQ